ncbi:MAG: hypothetical protein F6K31_12090, partial [Symploca sp. SIO2G7]|nr:hypothetical protein [Symploca sp. SIO2G7]
MSTTKSAGAEVSLVAMSMNKRRQPEHNQKGQRQQWGRKPPQQKVKRKLPQPPKQPPYPQSIVRPQGNRPVERQPTHPTYPRPEQRQAAVPINPTLPNFRATPPAQQSLYLEAGGGRKGQPIPGRKLSPPVKPAKDARKRRREYNKLRMTTGATVKPAHQGTASEQPNRQHFNHQSANPKRSPRGRRKLKRPVSSLVYIVRMVIVGIGIGAIAGT